MLQIPIFHINGEDPEAVAQAVDLAVDFRQKFKRDVVIDMWCYRKLGHNEGDEPGYTQPQMYRLISRKASVRAAYLEAFAAAVLPGETAAGVADAEAAANERRRILDEALEAAKRLAAPPKPSTSPIPKAPRPSPCRPAGPSAKPSTPTAPCAPAPPAPSTRAATGWSRRRTVSWHFEPPLPLA